jgi:hypothetical protein
VKTSGRAAIMNGNAKNAPRAVRSGPRCADHERTAMISQAIARATYDPTGSRLTARMKASVSRNFSRGSAACSQLGRAM